MAEDTKIEWTHHTFNPWSGCAKVHAGCTNCYAEALPQSMRRGARWGEVWQGGTRVVASDAYWQQPLGWARAAVKAGEKRRVFCASTADVLEGLGAPRAWPTGWGHSEIEEAYNGLRAARGSLDIARARLWNVIRATTSPGFRMPVLDWPGLDWLLLTKRPENWRLVPPDVRPLVWLGTSVSDQTTADDAVPRLLEAEGFRYRFLSVEPLVWPVAFWRSWLSVPRDEHSRRQHVGASIDWVIVGGESGRKARPCHVEWVRDVVRQCREAGVPCFVKQDSGCKPGLQGRLPDDLWSIKEFPHGS